MMKKTRNWLLALSILAFPFVLFFGFLVFMEEPVPPIAPLPNPNGYDDLVKSGQMIKGDYGDYDKASLIKLRAFVSTNTEALALARSALNNQCGVPVQFSKAYLTNHIQDMIAFRGLAQALVCDGKLAEKENRFSDAANSYLDTVHLGTQITRGGTLVDEMLSVAVVSLGETQLESVVTNLDAITCRETAVTLETLFSQRQTWNQTMQQENAWSRRTFSGIEGKTLRLYYKLVYYRTREQNHQRAIDTINSTQKKENQLIIDLAARAYELDKGRPPASAADLVPEYLKAVPQDPITGANTVYSPR
jgi:hypothetical protein